jgi:hypothetical protein
MTRQRRQPPEPPRERLRLEQPKATVEQLLSQQIHRGRSLAGRELSVYDEEAFREWRAELNRWRNYTREALRRAYNTEEPHDEFDRVVNPRVGFFTVGGPPDPLSERITETRRNTTAGINALTSLIERLELLDDPSDTPAVQDSAPTEIGTGVFVVHGRNVGLRDQVARTLQTLALEPLILAERTNEGRTLIEKFEANALHVGFAVVILAPEDYARGPDDTELPEHPNRARQNVILELGYFMGKLYAGAVLSDAHESELRL